jgi:hypothetical protein
MYRQNVHEQTEHEQVVAARVKQLKFLYRVLADPDIIRSDHTKGLYPDIIVMDEKNKVLFIEEIETEGSVTEKARNKRWINYSKLGYPFNLIVPKPQESKAKQLANGINIHKLYYYKLTPIGIRFRQVYNLNI